MKFSEQWLREWVQPAVSTDELAAQITMAGLEVDGVEAVAGQLKRVAGAHDLPARLGGDEFALLVWVDRAEQIEQRARALVDSVRLLALPEPLHVTTLTISVGAVACLPEAGWSVWYSQADRLLYRAKAEGGDDFRFQAEP